MAVLALALAVDLVLGDPPDRWHPVAWVGALAGRWYARGRRARPALQVLWGGLGVVVLGGFAAGAGLFAGRAGPLALPLEVLLLSSAFALRGLLGAAGAVGAALEAGELGTARERLARIVSRPTAELGPGHLAAGAIQSATENLCDSFVAPLFYYAVGGLPAALFYRVVNTLDAMVGYRGPTRWLGLVPARLDDLLNLVPARLSALLLLLAGLPRAGAGLRTWWRDRARTPSPNGGHPMAMAAGLLGVRLEKVGAYRLGDGPLPGAAHLRRSLRLVAAAGALAALLAALVRLAVERGG